MPTRPRVSVLAALGMTADEEDLYDRLVVLAGDDIDVVASRLVLPIEELIERSGPLVAGGLVEIADGRVQVPPLASVVAGLMTAEAEWASAAGERLDRLAAAITSLGAAMSRPGPHAVAGVSDLRGELTTGGNEQELLTSLVLHTEGDLCWLRPDAWQLPRENVMTRLVGDCIAQGRRSRAVYPAIALREAPDGLRARVAAGEEVRVVEHLPTRLLVLGTTHAVLPEPPGHHGDPRLLIRQPAVVAALTWLFDLIWEQAAPVRELDARSPLAERGYLLRQLARGAKDEQIARLLGLSLRTVRRRIADILDDLGVDTRFQAGAEAVRRGWL